MDPSDVVLKVNGAESDLFKIVDNTIVVAKDLTSVTGTVSIQLTADLAGRDPIASETISVTVENKLAKPVVTIGKVTDTSIKVTWEAVEGATGYRLQYIEADKADTEAYVTYNVTGLGGTIKKLAPDTNYIIRVNAVNSTSGAVSDRTIVEQKTAQAPSITIAQVAGSVEYDAIGTVVATFDAVSLDASDVVLLVNGEESDLFKIEGNNIVVAGSLLSVTQPISLQLTANLEGRDPIASETIAVAVEGKLAKPVVTISKVTDTSMKVTWEAVEGATGYRLQYIEADKADTGAYVTYNVTGLGGTIKNLRPETNYIIRVNAVNSVSGIVSDREILEQKTAATPTITVSQVETTVRYNAVGTVVATFETNFGDVPVVVYENGAPSDYFKVEGNTVVVSENLLTAANPHALELRTADGTLNVVSEEFVVNVNGKLLKPVVSLVETTADSVTISWAPVSCAANYSVQYSVGSSKTFKTVEFDLDELDVDADGNYTLALTGLSADQHYRVRVRALAGENGVQSDATYLDATTTAAVVAEAELDDEDLFDILALSILK